MAQTFERFEQFLREYEQKSADAPERSQWIVEMPDGETYLSISDALQAIPADDLAKSGSYNVPDLTIFLAGRSRRDDPIYVLRQRFYLGSLQQKHDQQTYAMQRKLGQRK